MKKMYFVTGTDTDCGKTYCTLQLMGKYRKQGKSVLGLKPVASGSIRTSEGLRNDDALKLQQASSIKLPYEKINPFTFEPPIAPHIAAELASFAITSNAIISSLQEALKIDCDIILIEGAGGLMVPINQNETWIDVIKALDIPVIFIVGLKLGCINHTLLSIQALQHNKINISEIIYNPLDASMLYKQENIDAIITHTNDHP
jgi:dethiobiotin synthetase